MRERGKGDTHQYIYVCKYVCIYVCIYVHVAARADLFLRSCSSARHHARHPLRNSPVTTIDRALDRRSDATLYIICLARGLSMPTMLWMEAMLALTPTV